MDFKQTLDAFAASMATIVNSGSLVTEKQIENASQCIENFSKLASLTDKEFTSFLYCCLEYFGILTKYEKQSEKVSPLQQFTIRKALGSFLVVVDKLGLYSTFIYKFKTLLDVMVESQPKTTNLKEYFRIYSHLLDNISTDILGTLASRHKSFSSLYNIIKDSFDIEFQAIIVEVVLKLFNHGSDVNIHNDLLEMVQFLDFSSLDKCNMYEHIRMVLDHLNQYSSYIFSINCNRIEIDACQVTEFYGASSHSDIWLDFNIWESKLSFFCEPKFAASIDDLTTYPISDQWEVLTFSKNDTTDIIFSYNADTECLNISFSLMTSSFTLFASSKQKKVCQLLITVSRYSERFAPLVEMVLPSIFGNKFSPTLLNMPVIEDNPNEESSDIECFQKGKRTSIKDTFRHTVTDSETIITLSDDDSVWHSQSKKVSKDNNSVISLFDDEDNKTDYIQFKTSLNTPHRTSFNKSTSPLSFTESLVGRRKATNKKTSTLNNNTKISKSITCSKNDVTQEKLKVSVSLPTSNKEPDADETQQFKSFHQETADLQSEKNASNISNEQIIAEDSKHLTKTQNNEIVLHKEKADCETKSIRNNETETDARYDIPDGVLNCSISKVQDWLQNRVVPITTQLDKNERGSNVYEDKEHLSDYIPSISARNTEKNTRMPVEEQIEIMMDEGQNESEKTQTVTNLKQKTTCGLNTVDSLLKILCSQDSAKVQEKGTIGYNENTPKKTHSSTSSSLNNVPLSVVKEMLTNKASTEKVFPKINNRRKRKSNEKMPSPITEAKRSKADIPTSTNVSTKRKLFNPNDLSYLNTLPKEYLELDNERVTRSQRGHDSSQITEVTTKPFKKIPKKHSKKTERPKKVEKDISERGRTMKRQDATFPAPKKTFNDIFNSLNERIREVKKKAKLDKIGGCSSSSSSMEPFGVCVEKMRKERKAAALTEDKFRNRRGKHELEERIKSRQNEPVDKKINIISNILIKSPQPLSHHGEAHECLPEITSALNKAYLQHITHIRACHPEQLINDDCRAIVNILQECAGQQ